MALSILSYTYAGGAQTFSLNFSGGYIERDDIQCQVNGEVDGTGAPVYTAFTFVDDGTALVEPRVLVVSDTVVFRRTVSKTDLDIEFGPSGDAVTPGNLNNQTRQTLHLVHEVLDGRIDTFEELVTDITDAKNAAETSAAAALVSETNAGTSETNAAASEAAAAVSAADAQTSADDAATTLANVVQKSGDTMTGALTVTGGGVIVDRTGEGVAAYLSIKGDSTNSRALRIMDNGGTYRSVVRINNSNVVQIGNTAVASNRLTGNWLTDSALVSSELGTVAGSAGTYITRAKGDARYVNVTGDTLTGSLGVNTTVASLDAEFKLTAGASNSSAILMYDTVSTTDVTIASMDPTGTLRIGSSAPVRQLFLGKTEFPNTMILTKNSGAAAPQLQFSAFPGGTNGLGVGFHTTSSSLAVTYDGTVRFKFEHDGNANGSTSILNRAAGDARYVQIGGFYTSGELVLTANSTLTHGLGYDPDNIAAWFICKTAELGYSVGDRVFANWQDNGAQAQGMLVVANASGTTLEVVANSGTFVLPNKSTGARTAGTKANWRYVVKAW